MITMNPAYLHDQAGMERAFRDYFRQVETEWKGTFNAMLSPRFQSCDFGDKRLTLRVEAQPWMTNPGGILHGGIISALMDFTMGLLCRYWNEGRMTPTLSMEVSYLRAAPLTGGICIEARVTKRGREFLYTQASLWAEDREDRLLTTSTGIYYAAGPEN